MFKHIVVGVDGREGGRAAVALARLLVAVGGTLTLAYVVAPDADAYRGTSGAPEASGERRAEALLEAVRAETGVEANLRWYEASSVGRGLHELCEVLGADLLVLVLTRAAHAIERGAEAAACSSAEIPAGVLDTNADSALRRRRR